MKRRFKKGESIVAVIVAMAVITVFGLTALFVSRTNYNMKVIDKKSTQNFYITESILNDITTGLQRTMSNVYTDSYTAVMANYRSFTTITDMQSAFNTEFVLALVEALKATEGSSNYAPGTTSSYMYSTQKLLSFIKAENYLDGTWTFAADDGNVATINDNILDTLVDGVALRNVHITYESKDGFFNEIYTDIKLSVPDLSFSLISAMPDIAEYVLVANSGIVVEGSHALTAAGNIYAGHEGTSTDSITLMHDSKFDCTKAPVVVADGSFVMDNASVFLTGGGRTASDPTKANTSFWATNFIMRNSAMAQLLGRSYIKDDTTVSGENVRLYLGGQYYGYSNGTTNASESSAIIINNKNAELHMADLNTLVLTGTAFVGTSRVTAPGGNTNYDILTGDSISVKSNQLAYLIPAECEGIATNPMSYRDYQKLIEDDEWAEKILNTVLSSINRSLSSYGNVGVTPVFSSRDSGTVYLYVNFESVASASAYFIDVFNSASTTGAKLREYLKQYLPAFELNTRSAQIITEGNYLIPASYDEVTGEFSDITYAASGYSAGSIPALMANTLSSYQALCKKLVTTKSSLTATELADNATVFSNLISEAMIDQFFSYGGAINGCTVTNTANGMKAVFDGGSGMQGIIIDNEGKAPYDVDVHGGTGVLIATGDVRLAGNWDGIIIAKGKITVISGSANNPVDISSNNTVTGKVFRMSCIAATASGTPYTDANNHPITISFLNFFKGGENYSLSESTGDIYIDYADVRNCVSYINWRTE